MRVAGRKEKGKRKEMEGDSEKSRLVLSQMDSY